MSVHLLSIVIDVLTALVPCVVIATAFAAFTTRLVWVSITPFDRPVVPPV